MSNYIAEVWEMGMDQNNRPCWINRQNGQVTYQLQDSNSFPLPVNYCGGYGMGMAMPQMGGYAYPMAMAGMGEWPPRHRPLERSQSSVAQSSLTSGRSKKMRTGTSFTTTLASLREPTGTSPRTSDNQKNAGQPAPPTAPKKKGPKYTTDRKGWWP